MSGPAPARAREMRLRRDRSVSGAGPVGSRLPASPRPSVMDCHRAAWASNTAPSSCSSSSERSASLGRNCPEQRNGRLAHAGEARVERAGSQPGIIPRTDRRGRVSAPNGVDAGLDLRELDGCAVQLTNGRPRRGERGERTRLPARLGSRLGLLTHRTHRCPAPQQQARPTNWPQSMHQPNASRTR